MQLFLRDNPTLDNCFTVQPFGFVCLVDQLECSHWGGICAILSPCYLVGLLNKRILRVRIKFQAKRPANLHERATQRKEHEHPKQKSRVASPE